MERIAHIPGIKILTWLQGFMDKLQIIFSQLHCLTTSRKRLEHKENQSKLEIWQESVGVLLEFSYIEHGLLPFQKVTSNKY